MIGQGHVFTISVFTEISDALRSVNCRLRGVSDCCLLGANGEDGLARRMAASNMPFLLALLAGGSFYATLWFAVDPLLHTIWKGAGVGLLAVWAATKARRTDQWLIATALGLGALGDVLLEASGLTVGAIAFLGGHIAATTMYLRNGAAPMAWAAGVAAGVSILATGPSPAPGIALYALGLGAMCGSNWVSRFPVIAKAGAALFVTSDLLLVAELGPLRNSPVPGLLIWPTYFAGQALIAWGVVCTLAGETRESLHHRL
ncbi:lysoplasmalogenase family protein [Sphingomonas sp. MMS12-HWE2-04]|uniref:lysoplasmalogenase family protein n=1 Tax=Sphingomonas sp. MMS12-HWE2-04 TaxID=3234199 RepID=UPI00384CAAF7